MRKRSSTQYTSIKQKGMIGSSRTTRIVTEQAFLKWCTDGHEAKYDLKNNEHLIRFKNDKIKFDKIDSKDVKFILNRILDQYARGKGRS